MSKLSKYKVLLQKKQTPYSLELKEMYATSDDNLVRLIQKTYPGLLIVGWRWECECGVALSEVSFIEEEKKKLYYRPE